MKNKDNKIVFLGTPEFSAVILEKLSSSPYRPSLVITRPDKPVGRKQIISPSSVKLIAEKYEIPIFQPKTKKDLELKIKQFKPDLGIVVAYKYILSEDTLKIPYFGFLNVHPSLLPKYRGPSPIQATILNGDKETGVTIILVDEKTDHGEIISKSQFSIPNSGIIYKELERELAIRGGELLVKTIPKWLKNKINPEKQDEKKATYTKIIRKNDGRIDWSMTAEEIERQIRAFKPWPGSFTFFKKSGKILKVKIIEAEISKKDIPQKYSIKCKKDYLIIKKLQPEGKKEMIAEDFIRGYGKPTLF